MDIAPELQSKVDAFFAQAQASLIDTLGIEMLTVTPDEIRARMPVNDRTKQPFGILHGGASVALAETLASFGAWLRIDSSSHTAVGIEINANHVRPVSEGWVLGTAKPIHSGASTQIWEVRICTEEGKLVSISRCTMAIIKNRN